MVRCMECGFLTLRYQDVYSNVQNSYPEADANYRERPTELPACYAFAHRLDAEADWAWQQWNLANPPDEDEKRFVVSVSRGRQEANNSVLLSERECDEYIRYIPAYSPRDHRERREAQARRDHERGLQRSDHKWRIINAALVVGTTAAVVAGSIFAASLSR